MLSVVIATKDSERTLLPTLAALIPGAAASVIREVIIADGGSADATSLVADSAGCRFIISDKPLGLRLRDAADTARGPWLLFLQPGVVPDSNWVADTARFMEETELIGLADARAAAFRQTPSATMRSFPAELMALLRTSFGAKPKPDQGLMIHNRLYASIGGHRDVAEPEADLISRLGRRRIVLLRAGVIKARN